MRKQVGLKFEVEDLARWDVFAEAQGWSRTTLFETAVERLIGGVAEAPPAKAAESQAPSSDRQHFAKPGGRRAYICQHTDRNGVLDCNRRIFLPGGAEVEVPECPEHGRMVAQPNRPYMGQATE